MRLHLWYLSEDLAALPLFSDDTPRNEKRAIVITLQKGPDHEDVHRLAQNKIHSFRNLSVADFVTRRSLNLFEALRHPQEFLTVAIDSWIERNDYKAACKSVYALMRVVNDCRKRC